MECDNLEVSESFEEVLPREVRVKYVKIRMSLSSLQRLTFRNSSRKVGSIVTGAYYYRISSLPGGSEASIWCSSAVFSQ